MLWPKLEICQFANWPVNIPDNVPDKTSRAYSGTGRFWALDATYNYYIEFEYQHVIHGHLTFSLTLNIYFCIHIRCASLIQFQYNYTHYTGRE